MKFASSECVVVDCFSEIFAWIGKDSNKEIRQLTKDFAKAIPEKDQRDSWCIVEIIYEGSESVLFRKKFDKWKAEKPRIEQLFVTPATKLLNIMLSNSSKAVKEKKQNVDLAANSKFIDLIWNTKIEPNEENNNQKPNVFDFSRGNIEVWHPF